MLLIKPCRSANAKELTGNDIFVSVLLDVVLFFCCFGGVGLVSAVLCGLGFQPLNENKRHSTIRHVYTEAASL